MSADNVQEGIVIGGYNVSMVCYSDESHFHGGMLMVGCRCGVGMENIITMTASSRRIDEVEGVSWSVVGLVITTEQHAMFALIEWMPFTTRNHVIPFFQHWYAHVG